MEQWNKVVWQWFWTVTLTVGLVLDHGFPASSSHFFHVNWLLPWKTQQRTKALRLILGDLATRNAAIAREESVTGEPVGGGDAAEGMRQVQAEIEFGGAQLFKEQWEDIRSKRIFK